MQEINKQKSKKEKKINTLVIRLRPIHLDWSPEKKTIWPVNNTFFEKQKQINDDKTINAIKFKKQNWDEIKPSGKIFNAEELWFENRVKCYIV